MTSPSRTAPDTPPLGRGDAERILGDLAAALFTAPAFSATASEEDSQPRSGLGRIAGAELVTPGTEAVYRALVEQIPAVVFMAYLDQGVGEAYVSPMIEHALGFTQEEWLEDPIRWYDHVHPEDRQRWSIEAAEMLVSGRPLRSEYRVISRDGRVIWFQCEAKIVRHQDGRPWFFQGVGFDITERKRGEERFRSLLESAPDAMVIADATGRIVLVNSQTERLFGYQRSELLGQPVELLLPERFRALHVDHRARYSATPRFRAMGAGLDLHGRRKDGSEFPVEVSLSPLETEEGALVSSAIRDITERKRMEKAVLEISGQLQRRIGQDLHDGLGQHLTGIAFLGKVLERKLADGATPEAADAKKIVQLVNEAINKTRELARGLLPVVSDADGLMAALKHWAGEVEDLFHISCQFQCPEPVLITDVSVATHLYHIAQEAVNNAVKHAHARHMVLSLTGKDGIGTLSIEDDGVGFCEASGGHTGLGLHIMRYRASMLGGSLELRRGPSGGTAVSCRFPLRP
jgi:PAS domain S-box-containing protein